MHWQTPDWAEEDFSESSRNSALLLPKLKSKAGRSELFLRRKIFWRTVKRLTPACEFLVTFADAKVTRGGSKTRPKNIVKFLTADAPTDGYAKLMRIALLSTFEETVPPKMYGGSERVVYTLAEEWVKMGHEVTLFASGDSDSSAHLIPATPRAIRVLREARDPTTRQALNLDALANSLQYIKEGTYDIIHNHFGWQSLLFNAFLDLPMVTTLHGTLDKHIVPTEHKMHNYFRWAPFVSISNSQRRHSPKLNYVATIYHGLYPEEFEFNDKPKDYLLFLGRIHPQKGPVHAIKIAKATGQKLLIAAKTDPAEFDYLRNRVRPLIDGKQIIWIGEVGHDEKVHLLKDARALLSPIQWDEPFGIVNIEAMACGTPVITMRRGSMPEVIDDGKTGFLCRNVSEMRSAVGKIDQIDRAYCRAWVQEHFTARVMAENYIKVFDMLLKARRLKRSK